jgi:hypothetical protein
MTTHTEHTLPPRIGQTNSSANGPSLVEEGDPAEILSTLEDMPQERTDTAIVLDTPHADFDRKLIESGYEPVVVEGKKPVEDAWQAGEITAERIAGVRRSRPYAKSTGLRTGRLVGIDLDVYPREHAEKIKELAFEVLGENDMQRVGSKGAMLLYRNETPISKLTIKGEHEKLLREVRKPGKSPYVQQLPVQIEILGKGQQLVAYGKHPETGREYHWPHRAAGAEPLQRPLRNLPETTPDKIREFIQRAPHRRYLSKHKGCKYPSRAALFLHGATVLPG